MEMTMTTTTMMTMTTMMTTTMMTMTTMTMMMMNSDHPTIFHSIHHSSSPDESGSMSQTTEQLSTTLRHLKKFTNYSVQVLARTKIGEGIASSPVYVATLEDG